MLELGHAQVGDGDEVRCCAQAASGALGLLQQAGPSFRSPAYCWEGVMNPQEQSKALSKTAACGNRERRMGISLCEVRWMARGGE